MPTSIPPTAPRRETPTVLPDPQADQTAYVFATADLREGRIRAAESYFPGPWRRGPGYFSGYGVVADARGAEITKHFERESPADHIAAEANPKHALAEVRLWRGIAGRHVQGWTDPKVQGNADSLVVLQVPQCASRCGTWPCSDLLDVVAACQAYAEG